MVKQRKVKFTIGGKKFIGENTRHLYLKKNLNLGHRLLKLKKS